MKPKFSIIIPLLIQHEWQFNMTVACIQNIQAFSHNYELIILHSMAGYRRYSENIKSKLRKRDTYKGFKNNPSQAEALNIGIAKAKGEYIILIGNDNFVHEGWLKAIENRLGNQERPILACWVDRMPPRKAKSFIKSVQKDYDGIQPVNFSYVNFQGVTIPKKILDDIGKIDENLPFYLWEMDLNRRLEKLGYGVGVVLDALMTTPQSMTRVEGTLPDDIENWWTDESFRKEQLYFNKKYQ